MLIEYLKTDKFRNLSRIEFKPEPGLNILLGRNAQGKTNLIEAIYVLARTNSFRTSADHHLAGYEHDFFLVKAAYRLGERKVEAQVYYKREKGKEFVGTAAALWGITAGVYLALMGPRGMQELGEGIMQRVAYAMRRLSAIRGLGIPVPEGVFFKEFPLNFDGTGQTVADINRALLARGIFGGKDISQEFPALGQTALYCITEVHSRRDIDRLVTALQEIVHG